MVCLWNINLTGDRWGERVLPAQVANPRSTGWIRLGPLFLPGGSAELLLNCSGVVTFIQSWNYIRPSEGNREADVAPCENEFDTLRTLQLARSARGKSELGPDWLRGNGGYNSYQMPTMCQKLCMCSRNVQSNYIICSILAWAEGLVQTLTNHVTLK